MKELIGEQMIKLDLLSFEQAEMILQFQKRNSHMKFGEIAVHLGFLEKDNISGQYSTVKE
jgi:hypothetical protein